MGRNFQKKGDMAMKCGKTIITAFLCLCFTTIITWVLPGTAIYEGGGSSTSSGSRI